MKKLFQAVMVALMLVPSVGVTQSIAIGKCGSATRVTCIIDGDTIWFEGEKIRIMLVQPGLHLGRLVGGVVVEHQMHIWAVTNFRL